MFIIGREENRFPHLVVCQCLLGQSAAPMSGAMEKNREAADGQRTISLASHCEFLPI